MNKNVFRDVYIKYNYNEYSVGILSMKPNELEVHIYDDEIFDKIMFNIILNDNINEVIAYLMNGENLLLIWNSIQPITSNYKFVDNEIIPYEWGD